MAGNWKPGNLAGSKRGFKGIDESFKKGFIFGPWPYRLAPGEEYAMSELRRCSGTQFDPEVAGAFLRVLEEKNRNSGPFD